jgi:hypothetical protein
MICRRVVLTLTLVFGIAGCAYGDDRDGPGVSEPADTGALAASQKAHDEVARHGRIDSEHGCERHTTGQLRDIQTTANEESGTPIDGWLLDSPRDTKIWVCDFEGEFEHRSPRMRAVFVRDVAPVGVKVPEISLLLGEIAEEPLGPTTN